VNKTEGIASKTHRDSNIELLRILVMLCIVGCHYVSHSGLAVQGGPIYSDITNWRSLFLLVAGAWGGAADNCFVIISSYFMCKKDISARKFIKLLAEVYFYKIVLYLVFVFAGQQSLSIDALYMLLPLSSVTGNFADCFLIFYLCIPFLNVLVRSMNEYQHLGLLALLMVVYVGFELIPKFKVSFNFATWFCILFIITSYVRLYPKKIFNDTKFWGIVSAIMIVLAILSIICCAVIPVKIGISPVPDNFTGGVNKIFAIGVAFSVFMFFKNLKVKYMPLINTVATTVFGVYLIHTYWPVGQFLWGDVFKCGANYWNPYLPLYFIFCVLCVFIGCSVVDLLRIHLFEKPFMSFYDKHINQRWLNLKHRLRQYLDKNWVNS